MRLRRSSRGRSSAVDTCLDSVDPCTHQEQEPKRNQNNESKTESENEESKLNDSTQGEDEELVGEDEEGLGYVLGVAPSYAQKPLNTVNQSDQFAREQKQDFEGRAP